MDSPYKNYVIYVENKKHNKYVYDMLMNKVRMFKKDTIQFNNFYALEQIQPIFFNDALLSGLKVKDFVEYYKRLDFVKYQEIIPNFNFDRIMQIKLEYLDYDSLFYLQMFTMMFINKKIFIIDNYSLSKISTKVVNLVGKNNMNY